MKHYAGKTLDYFWVEFSSTEFDLISLVEQIPNLLIGKYLAIICFDGGIFVPTEEERLRGWNKIKQVSFSPILTKAELKGPIFENHDQWCLFETKSEIESMTDFVNYGMFTLKNRDFELDNIDPTWDKVALKNDLNQTEKLLRKFWLEMKELNPDNFILNGDNFIYCSKNEKEIERIITVANTMYN
ncbi:hypothetical protein JCM19275_1321 [Nonlabens ulvanivorans]|uniref:Uncharacterized protein n=1 Tax=Nonlabens ulvanivorans TaxID=906888 RepID=A0A090QGB1_NONUL|nr:hypothetical protein [Nonlabens ulvanivorans]GAL01283.1 hypothetical protein JCM19314_727 [Nonlabens ulvanivorans]GAL76577.1 hypothetical protein JCM19275_1321 [Nonlabens ulvanivorans]